jgi:hypothetical protein
MALPTHLRFRLAALAMIASALIVGYFNVGSLYLFGLPFLPLIISAFFLWLTKTSMLKKGLATLVALSFVPVGFCLFVWWVGATVHFSL